MIVVLILVFFYDWDIHAFLNMVLSAFDYESSYSAYIRRIQFFALIKEWRFHPIFGAGPGAIIKEIVRSEIMPWAFELTYVSLLYQLGLVGITLYAVLLAWIYKKARFIFNLGSVLSFHLLPILIGTTSFLIANATNPYLFKFAYLWIIFLPIAIINVRLLKLKYEGFK